MWADRMQGGWGRVGATYVEEAAGEHLSQRFAAGAAATRSTLTWEQLNDAMQTSGLGALTTDAARRQQLQAMRLAPNNGVYRVAEHLVHMSGLFDACKHPVDDLTKVLWAQNSLPSTLADMLRPPPGDARRRGRRVDRLGGVQGARRRERRGVGRVRRGQSARRRGTRMRHRPPRRRTRGGGWRNAGAAGASSSGAGAGAEQQRRRRRQGRGRSAWPARRHKARLPAAASARRAAQRATLARRAARTPGASSTGRDRKVNRFWVLGSLEVEEMPSGGDPEPEDPPACSPTPSQIQHVRTRLVGLSAVQFDDLIEEFVASDELQLARDRQAQRQATVREASEGAASSRGREAQHAADSPLSPPD